MKRDEILWHCDQHSLEPVKNVNKWENGWSNFSASFRVMAIKFTELIRFALPNQWFFSISYVRFNREDVIMSHRFLCVELASTSFSLCTLGEVASDVNKLSTYYVAFKAQRQKTVLYPLYFIQHSLCFNQHLLGFINIQCV